MAATNPRAERLRRRTRNATLRKRTTAQESRGSFSYPRPRYSGGEGKGEGVCFLFLPPSPLAGEGRGEGQNTHPRALSSRRQPKRSFQEPPSLKTLFLVPTFPTR